jgi:hypothetical protein
MTSAPRRNIEIAPSESLTWFQSSATAERGFCNICGGNVFWRELQSDAISITAGTLDIPTGIAMEQHIFVADKSDYYTLDDGIPDNRYLRF